MDWQPVAHLGKCQRAPLAVENQSDQLAGIATASRRPNGAQQLSVRFTALLVYFLGLWISVLWHHPQGGFGRLGGCHLGIPTDNKPVVAGAFSFRPG